MIVATFLGRVVNRRIAVHRFLLYVHVGLIAVGAILLLQALIGLAGLRIAH